MSYTFHPFPELHTERLHLRMPRLSDAPDMFKMRSDPEVMRYIPRPLATSIADAEELINLVNDYTGKGERINWAMEWKETGEMIGMIGYVDTIVEHHRAEVGYSLARQWHRKGIMREALQAVLTYGFDVLDLHTVAAVIDARNEASGKLLEHVGFRQEAYFREDFLFDGRYRDSVFYGMMEGEFRELRKGW